LLARIGFGDKVARLRFPRLTGDQCRSSLPFASIEEMEAIEGMEELE